MLVLVICLVEIVEMLLEDAIVSESFDNFTVLVHCALLLTSDALFNVLVQVYEGALRHKLIQLVPPTFTTFRLGITLLGSLIAFEKEEDLLCVLRDVEDLVKEGSFRVLNHALHRVRYNEEAHADHGVLLRVQLPEANNGVLLAILLCINLHLLLIQAWPYVGPAHR